MVEDFLTTNLQLLVSGIMAGSVYVLTALGLVIIYKPTGVVNYGHGDIAMLGAYFAVQTLMLTKIPALIAIALLVPIGFVIGGAIGAFLNIPLKKNLIVSIIMGSLGIGMMLQSAYLLRYGGSILVTRPIFPNEMLAFGPVRVQSNNLWTIIITLVLMAVMFAFFKFTNTGLAMRAVAQSRDAALLRGVNPGLVVFASWGMASVFAMISTFFLSSQMGAFPMLGMIILGKAFTAAVIGGLNNLGGTILGAFLLAVIDTFIAGYLNADMQVIGSFVIVLLVLLLRPQGLFARQAQARLA